MKWSDDIDPPLFYRNESFTQTLSGEPAIFDFKVKDYNRLSHAVDLGQFRRNIWDLVQPTNRSVDQWVPLYPIGSGELHLRIDFEASSSH
jgi:hypothetical protein